MKKKLLVGLFMYVLVSAGTTWAIPPGYTVTDLGSLGPDYSIAFGLNDLGQVVGQSWNQSTVAHAFLWTKGTGLSDIGELRDENWKLRINNAGQVVGNLLYQGQAYHAVVWESGVVTDIGHLGGAIAESRDINGSGHVVGFSRTSTGMNHAFLWKDGQMTDLMAGVIASGSAFAVNDSDHAVGYSYESGPQVAHLWKDGASISLGRLPGHTGSSYSEAYDINNNGQIVGYSWKSMSSPEPFIWENGVIQALPNAGAGGRAYAINDLGQAVGPSGGVAVLWENNVRYSLNDLIPPDSGWILWEAYDINEGGQIVGYGRNPNGQSRPFLLTPIPEPATMLLLCGAAVPVLLKRRRKSRA